MIDVEKVAEIIGTIFLLSGGVCLTLVIIGLVAFVTGAIWVIAIYKFKGLRQKQRNQREGGER